MNRAYRLFTTILITLMLVFSVVPVISNVVPGMDISTAFAAEKLTLGATGFMDSALTTLEESAATAMKNLKPVAIWLWGILGIIEIVTIWSLYEGRFRMSEMISLILKLSFYLFLILNWAKITMSLIDFFERMGALAGGTIFTKEAMNVGGTSVTVQTIVNSPSKIIDAGWNVVNHLWDRLSIKSPVEGLFTLVAMLLTVVGFFLMAFEMFVTRLELMFFIALSVLFLPLNVCKFTQSFGQNLFGGLVGYGAKLMVIIFLIGIIFGNINMLQNNTGSGGGSTGGSTGVVQQAKQDLANDFKFGFIVLALGLMVMKAGSIAQSLVSGGGPSSSHRDLMAVGAAGVGYATGMKNMALRSAGRFSAAKDAYLGQKSGGGDGGGGGGMTGGMDGMPGGTLSVGKGGKVNPNGLTGTQNPLGSAGNVASSTGKGAVKGAEWGAKAGSALGPIGSTVGMFVGAAAGTIAGAAYGVGKEAVKKGGKAAAEGAKEVAKETKDKAKETASAANSASADAMAGTTVGDGWDKAAGKSGSGITVGKKGADGKGAKDGTAGAPGTGSVPFGGATTVVNADGTSGGAGGAGGASGSAKGGAEDTGSASDTGAPDTSGDAGVAGMVADATGTSVGGESTVMNADGTTGGVGSAGADGADGSSGSEGGSGVDGIAGSTVAAAAVAGATGMAGNDGTTSVGTPGSDGTGSVGGKGANGVDGSRGTGTIAGNVNTAVGMGTFGTTAGVVSSGSTDTTVDNRTTMEKMNDAAMAAGAYGAGAVRPKSEEPSTNIPVTPTVGESLDEREIKEAKRDAEDAEDKAKKAQNAAGAGWQASGNWQNASDSTMAAAGMAATVGANQTISDYQQKTKEASANRTKRDDWNESKAYFANMGASMKAAGLTVVGKVAKGGSAFAMGVGGNIAKTAKENWNNNERVQQYKQAGSSFANKVSEGLGTAYEKSGMKQKIDNASNSNMWKVATQQVESMGHMASGAVEGVSDMASKAHQRGSEFMNSSAGRAMKETAKHAGTFGKTFGGILGELVKDGISNTFLDSYYQGKNDFSRNYNRRQQFKDGSYDRSKVSTYHDFDN